MITRELRTDSEKVGLQAQLHPHTFSCSSWERGRGSGWQLFPAAVPVASAASTSGLSTAVTSLCHVPLRAWGEHSAKGSSSRFCVPGYESPGCYLGSFINGDTRLSGLESGATFLPDAAMPLPVSVSGPINCGGNLIINHSNMGSTGKAGDSGHLCRFP